MIKKPPLDNLGYKFDMASMVDSYISPSNRRMASLSIGAFGSVSLNQPARKQTWSSSKLYLEKCSLTFSSETARYSGSCQSAPLSAGYFSASGGGSPLNESATQTFRFSTP